jgi:ketosteroid isomerase-like protein
MKKALFIFFLQIVIFYSCQPTSSGSNKGDATSLLTADRNFSNLSKEKGMISAFLQYIDSGGVLLRAGHYPIVGEKAFSYLQNEDDSGITLTWEPSSGEIAASGDLGFTYGIYTFSGKDTTFRGTYVSIWKKQKDNSWKFVLDTGNPGVDKK